MLRTRRLSWLGASVLLGGGAAAAQVPVQLGAQPVGEVVIPYVVDVDLRRLPRVPAWRPGGPVLVGSTHERGLAGSLSAPPGAIDRSAIRRQDTILGGSLDPAFHLPILNMDGQSFGGVDPPDTMGAVGPEHYVQTLRVIGGTSVVVYDKVGSVAAGPFFLDDLGSGDCADGLGDPVALYDQLADRWLLSEFSVTGDRLCVYVSRTPDPVTGGWFHYDFQAPDFPDFPKYGVWSDAYYVSTRELAMTGGSPSAYALDRQNMIAGSAARPFQRFSVPRLAGFTFQSLTAADLDGSVEPPAGAPGIFARHRDDEYHEEHPDPSRDFLDLYLFSVDWNTPANSTFTGPVPVSITEFDSSICHTSPFRCLDQPGGGQDLAPQREVVMWRLQYRNFGAHEALIGNFLTEVGTDQGGIRWFELRQVTGGGWTVSQEGTFAPGSADRWMGSIAQDRFGNIALAYNVMDETRGLFAGLRYTGRLATDPPGLMTQGEAVLVAGSDRNGSSRYGDYASMTVDPSDDCTFWFTGEYNAAPQYSTRIAAFRFDGCGPSPSGPVIEVSGACGGSVQIDVSGATPNAEVAIVGAAGATGFIKGGSRCAGVQLEVGEPFLLPPSFVITDGSGRGSGTMSLPATRCWVEALDLASCLTSNAVDTSPQ